MAKLVDPQATDKGSTPLWVTKNKDKEENNMTFYVDAVTLHNKNHAECLFRETAIGENKKACIKMVLENLADYSRQDSFLDDSYADIKIYSVKLVDGVYTPDSVIEHMTVERLGDYLNFLAALN